MSGGKIISSDIILVNDFLTTIRGKYILTEATSIPSILDNPEEVEEVQEYEATGLGTDDSKRLTNLDFIYAMIFGVLGGIISSLVPFSLLIKVWYPFVGGAQFVSAHHVIWGALVYGLTKKKNNIMLVMSVKGILEFLFNDPWGVLIIFVNLFEGAFLVLGFILAEKFKEGDTRLGWVVAGGFGNFFQAPFFWLLNQRFYLHWVLWVITFSFAIISGMLIIGIMARSLTNNLIKAGVPTTF
ncbi:MAG: ECF transporter S component [Candidatus Lokiarchaeota archaeon]|nr:ECF transporter S component [Candidatus Lokiarchaeota archaeon]